METVIENDKRISAINNTILLTLVDILVNIEIQV